MKKIVKYSFLFWFALGIRCVDVNAQYSPALWIRQAGMNQFSADAPKVIYDGGDHIYFMGHFSKTFKYDDVVLEEKGISNIFVSKLDTLGNLIWIKRFWNNSGYSEKFLYYLTIRYAAVDKNQNIYFTGAFKDTINAVDTTFYALGEDHDIYLMKMTPDGEIDWFYNMIGGVVPYQVSTSLSIDENNDIILTTRDYWHNFLFKFNSSGELLWSKEFESLYDCDISSVVTDKENNIYISGRFEDYIAFGNDTIFSMAGSGKNGFYAKFDENGDYIWARLIGSYCQNYNVNPSLRIDTSMNILITCGIPFCAVYIGQDSIEPLDIRAKLMAMMDPEGNILWYKQAYSNNNIGMANLQDYKNNIYSAVSYRNCSYIGFSDSIIPGEGAFLLTKLDDEGNIQWMKNQGGSISNNIWLTSFAADFSDNLYVTGHFEGLAIFGDTSFYSPPNKKSIFIAKINKDSWVIEPLSVSQSNDLTPAIGPNPVAEKLYINLQTDKKTEYSIYNIYGNKIASGFIENGRKVLKMDRVSSGIYFLVIKYNGEQNVYKFIKK